MVQLGVSLSPASLGQGARCRHEMSCAVQSVEGMAQTIPCSFLSLSNTIFQSHSRGLRVGTFYFACRTDEAVEKEKFSCGISEGVLVLYRLINKEHGNTSVR